MASWHDRQPSNGPSITGVAGAKPLDRRRIDSEVRELLRQPSTPWITYNRASRASNLAEGDLLPRRASIVEAGALAAAPLAAPDAPSTVTEPSGVAVATDIEPLPVAGSQAARAAVALDGVAAGGSRARWSPLSIAVVAAGMTLSAGLLLAASMYQAPGRAAAAGPATTRAVAAVDTSRSAAAPSEPTPPDLAAALGEASLAKPSAPPAATGKEGAHDGPRFGRLTIRGAAKHKDVYFDGKRMLGSGKRSFTVYCGPHTISINQRHGGTEVEVPCNGELVVDR